MNRPILPLLLVQACLVGSGTAAAPKRNVNYDESKIVPYQLPKVLETTAGKPIRTAAEWTGERRPELLALFERHVYGAPPPATAWGRVAFEVLATKADALGGKATRKIIRITLPEHPDWAGMEVMLHIPNGGAKPVPCFVGLSFGGNHAVSAEPDVPISTRWMREEKDGGVADHRATPANRGTESARWPLAMIIGQGCAVASCYCGDIEPDHADGWRDGVRAALAKDGKATVWRDGDWGSIGAWAWGLSRIADYLATEPAVDAGKLAVIGHSRLGKTALWAGARDERFAVVVSNNSGEGGAALMRRNIGETTAVITTSFPHWFTKTYAGYADNAAACPVDQHELIALVAPRAVYIASAADDAWADPKGEFLSGLEAEPVFALFGRKGYGVAVQPPPGQPVGGAIAYHIRPGKHDITEYDWQQYLAFLKRQCP